MNYVVNYDDTDKIDYYGNYKINMDIINEMNLTCVCGIVGLYNNVCWCDVGILYYKNN